MSSALKNIEGHYYPEFHFGWGSCAEELFHYTSRYYPYTEAFLRNLADMREFRMSGYQANQLSTDQRKLMAAILSYRPDMHSARDIIDLVSTTLRGEGGVRPEHITRYRYRLKQIPRGVKLLFRDARSRPNLDEVSPLDPFLNIAERLMIPVAVKDHHVEVSLNALAEHLDSPNPRVRANLQEAVLRLHNAGYLLRNHPGLTHKEAKSIADEDAV